MARSSRRTEPNVQSAVTVPAPVIAPDKRMNTAAYVRLSVEQEDDDTIQNQAEYIKDYIQNHDELELTGVYMDHGFSGTNFDRPEFSRMMIDIQSGLINCVVVKDLSRFGRNFLETGYYLETLLPKLNVRLIAINDDYDSSREEDRDNIAIPVKNMVNEMYAKDQSRKVSLANARARARGTYTLEHSVYGYSLDQENNNYVVNPDTAPVVQLAFRWFLQGITCGQIAARFNMMGIITPMEYKCNNEYEKEMKASQLWNSGKVRDILKRDVYAGDLILGMRRRELYKNYPKDRKMPQEEWTVYKDHHVPLVPREDVEKVRGLLQEHVKNRREVLRRNEALNPERNKVFNKLVYCKKCNRIMYQDGKIHEDGKRRSVGNTYMCKGRIGLHDKNGCFQSINDDLLRVIVSDQIRNLAKNAVDTDKLLQELKKKQDDQNPIRRYENQIGTLALKEEDIVNKIQHLYVELSNGVIEEDDYQELRDQYQKERAAVRIDIDSCRNRLEQAKTRIQSFEDLAETLRQYLDEITITRELAEMLIDRIYIDNGKVREIRFKCRDVFRDVLEMLKEGGIS